MSDPTAGQHWPGAGGRVPQRGGSSGSRTALWVLLAVLAVVLVALVVWAVVGRGGSQSTVSPSPSATTQDGAPSGTATADPSASPTGSATDDWGPVPPPNAGGLKDFADPALPESIAPFVREEPQENVGVVSVFYQDDEVFRSVLVTVLMGTHHYASSVADMADPTAFGAAVCGTVTDDIGDELRCVVAGSSATLETGSADIEYLTIEELAAFTNELHEQL